MSVLKQKILDRTVTLGVVGLGYVGLPLAVEKAKAGFHVIGFDVQPQKVDMVNQGHNYIGDVVDSDLKKIVEEGLLRATTDFASVASCDCVCIAVPTPLDEHQQPDISYVRSSAESIMPHMHRDMLVVLESTTYPGTTEEMLRPILEKSGLKCGEDFFLAFSPERVDPGNASENEIALAVSRYQLFVAGNEYWLIDQLNTIMRVGGVDYAKDIRSVL